MQNAKKLLILNIEYNYYNDVFVIYIPIVYPQTVVVMVRNSNSSYNSTAILLKQSQIAIYCKY